ncbi:MAG: methionine--tRNA ligase subunit beta [Planctomycetes bacterium]|nr:methionine--tRNA ligase subunit beta [Planctomycetota bacterium]
MPDLTYDQFKQIDLRVGLITTIEDHPNANKLYVLKVDLGEGVERQLVAGLRPYYPDKAALLGKRIIVVANLAPAVLRGIESRGMLLAAQDGDRVIILTTDEPMTPGSKVL